MELPFNLSLGMEWLVLVVITGFLLNTVIWQQIGC